MLDHKGIWTQWGRGRKMCSRTCLKWISPTKSIVDTGEKKPARLKEDGNPALDHKLKAPLQKE